MDARDALRQWWISYTEGPEMSPWPNDPDGGEARIAAALGKVMDVLDEHERYWADAVGPHRSLTRELRTAITTEFTKEN